MMIVCWHSRVGVGGTSYLGQYLLQAYHDFIVIIMSFSVMFAILQRFIVCFLWHIVLGFCSCGGLTKTMLIMVLD
jgi:hypothetical protein